jgi:exonuclease III
MILQRQGPLWRKITQANFTSDHIVVGGDFNHLEETTRRGVSGERQIHRHEAAAWHQMTLCYGLADAWRLDSFRKMTKKNFTFNNGRSEAHSALSRIDKFLVSQDIEERGETLGPLASFNYNMGPSPLS